MQKDDCTYHKGSSRDDVKAHKDTSNKAMKNYIDDYKIIKHPELWDHKCYPGPLLPRDSHFMMHAI